MSSSAQPVDQLEDSATPPPAPHLPAHQYSYRVPSPPRVIIPPPTYANGFTGLSITDWFHWDFESNGFANSEFLKTVTYGDFMNPDGMLSWQYEQRRTAQKILPFLFLGPYSSARDLEFLRREGITMVMAVRDTMSAQANLLTTRTAVKAGIASCSIDVAGNQELIAAFPRAIEAINAHLSANFNEQQRANATLQSHGQAPVPFVLGKALVFCESGNERSAGVVTAYIMAMFSMALVPAIQIVQTQRFCVSFDDSLRFLLQSYGTILQAKRDVVKSAQMMNAPHPNGEQAGTGGGASDARAAMWAGGSSKRTLDEAYEDDDDMEIGGDSGERDDGRFEKREGFAPFEDAVES